MKLLFLTSILFICATVNAQLKEADVKILRQEMLRLVNNLRKEKGVNLLVADSKLESAATIHNQYMIKTGILSHDETVLAEPSDRVKKAGGDEFESVGENILSTVPQKFPMTNDQLVALANSMFDQWKNSPPHYKNMIEPVYTTAGFDFRSNAKSEVYGTQVFARKGAVVSDKLSKNAFGIKQRTAECEGLLHNKENLITNIGNAIYIEGNEVMLAYHNIRVVEEVFSQENDGIAVDIIEHKQLLCGKPNLLDVSPIYDGKLLKPVYREELLSNNRAESDYRLISKIGELPSGLKAEDVSISLVFIKNGRECAYNFPVKIPAKEYEFRKLDLKLDNPENTTLVRSGIFYSEEVEADFKRNATTGKLSKFELSEDKIHSITIKSHSSVEGPAEHNDYLQRKRAEFIKDQLHKKLTFDDSIVTINASENWAKMNFQLDYFDYSSISTQSHDSIKNYLKKTRSPFLDSLLFTQRHSSASIHYQKDFTEMEVPDEFIAGMNLRTAIITHNDDQANRAMYEMFQQEDFDFTVLFEETVFNELCANKKLVKNAAALLSKVCMLYPYEVTEFLASWSVQMNDLSKEAQFNLVNLYALTSTVLLSDWDVPSQSLAKVIHPRKFETVANNLGNNELILNFHLSAIHYFGQINDGENINRSFEYISAYFKKNKLSVEEEKDLVLFYNAWSSYSLTINQLLSNYKNKGFSPELMSILAKTAMAYQYWGGDKDLESVVNRYFELNPISWCEWVKENEQLKRYDYIKSTFCESCK